MADCSFCTNSYNVISHPRWEPLRTLSDPHPKMESTFPPLQRDPCLCDGSSEGSTARVGFLGSGYVAWFLHALSQEHEASITLRPTCAETPWRRKSWRGWEGEREEGCPLFQYPAVWSSLTPGTEHASKTFNVTLVRSWLLLQTDCN